MIFLSFNFLSKWIFWMLLAIGTVDNERIFRWLLVGCPMQADTSLKPVSWNKHEWTSNAAGQIPLSQHPSKREIKMESLTCSAVLGDSTACDVIRLSLFATSRAVFFFSAVSVVNLESLSLFGSFALSAFSSNT